MRVFVVCIHASMWCTYFWWLAATLLPPAMLGGRAEWSWEENRAFEDALATLDYKTPGFLRILAAAVPTKSVQQIHERLNELVEDIRKIESGLVPLPNYRDTADEAASIYASNWQKKDESPSDKKPCGQLRKKPVPWTKQEHELFLVGLEKYGRGDWRSISRNYLQTRTPTQIASHAQKHFLRIQRRAAAGEASHYARYAHPN